MNEQKSFLAMLGLVVAAGLVLGMVAFNMGRSGTSTDGNGVAMATPATPAATSQRGDMGDSPATTPESEASDTAPTATSPADGKPGTSPELPPYDPNKPPVIDPSGPPLVLPPGTDTPPQQ